ncbi:hypothetical protein Dalu01_03117 [Deinococcus aluminii]|uniref:Uncharacterized protein n=1 Tax=Deinococcus aluminii TaxID=1656885 RepID=A0ABP9XH56_9DEIO
MALLFAGLVIALSLLLAARQERPGPQHVPVRVRTGRR